MVELCLTVGSVIGLLASVVAARILLVRMPADYFQDPQPEPGEFRARHPVIRWSVRIAKNLLGILLVGAGLVMLLTPGPGLLALVFGVWLLDLPGKRRLQQRIVGYGPVLKAINKARLRRGLEPLELNGDKGPLPKSGKIFHSAER